jgi:hypothetical protein
MTRDHRHKPDSDVNGARIVAESTHDETALRAAPGASWAF